MTDSPKDTDDAEITPEMIEAGTAVLCRMELAFADEEFWAEKVYRAMAAVAADSHTSRSINIPAICGIFW